MHSRQARVAGGTLSQCDMQLKIGVMHSNHIIPQGIQIDLFLSRVFVSEFPPLLRVHELQR